MEFIKKVGIGALVAIIPIALVYLGFLQKKAELKYTISESISLNKNNDSSVSVQQLRISNTGDLPITTIVIKIKSKIIDYYVQKYKDSDSILVVKKPNYFELVYPLIPKENKILINLYTSELNIINDKIEITHSDGKAIEAFLQSESVSIIQAVQVALYGFYVLLFLYFIYNLKISNFIYFASYSEKIQIIERKKPWYLLESKWIRIRK